ncbi:Pentatricopeptide repeat-containing protein, chloroplastic [Glycine soja]|uniref:Pentatricopeptide repeat-containing protein, chloroplastic n=1 Tax=Glycine soja TaxID=3848 RepID=A0A0B2PM07_GLYSO|nr:Pentatricopeptide repeat-containing protein, chloroplastic [Glycine soja]
MQVFAPRWLISFQVTYNSIVGVLARTNSIEKLWRVVEEMKSAGHELDIETYIKLSRMLLKNKMLEDVVKLYELIMDGHCSYKPSVGDCLLLLKSISASDMPDLDLVFSAGKLDEAENVVNHMRNAGYEPDNTYIQSSGHCDANEIDRALLCLHETIEKGCKADAAVLGVLIDSFLSQKRIDDGYKLLVKIVRKHDAVKFLKAWSKGSPQSRFAYLRVFKSLLGKGRHRESKYLLNRLVHRLDCISQRLIPFLNPKTLKIAKANASAILLSGSAI